MIFAFTAGYRVEKKIFTAGNEEEEIFNRIPSKKIYFKLIILVSWRQIDKNENNSDDSIDDDDHNFYIEIDN